MSTFGRGQHHGTMCWRGMTLPCHGVHHRREFGAGAGNRPRDGGKGAQAVVMAGRDQARLDEAVAAIRAELPDAGAGKTIICDLGSLESIPRLRVAKHVNASTRSTSSSTMPGSWPAR